MHGVLFPFEFPPVDGHEFTFEYLNKETDIWLPTEENEPWDSNPWPGLDLAFNNRTTYHRYMFKMPYVYYLGEIVEAAYEEEDARINTIFNR